MARLVAALFSEKSRNLIKANPKRHLIWVVSVIVVWILMTILPGYLGHKYRVEAKRKFIELMRHDLKVEAGFANVGLDTNHLHFLSVTGVVDSIQHKTALDELITKNKQKFYAAISEEVTISTNANK